MLVLRDTVDLKPHMMIYEYYEYFNSILQHCIELRELFTRNRNSFNTTKKDCKKNDHTQFVSVP